MTNEVEVCAKFKQAIEQAEDIELTVIVDSSTAFNVLDEYGYKVMMAPTLDTLYYVLYGWNKCLEKYRDRITPE
jgi:hypothetical protein